jgi:hypothetical protein
VAGNPLEPDQRATWLHYGGSIGFPRRKSKRLPSPAGLSLGRAPGFDPGLPAPEAKDDSASTATR